MTPSGFELVVAISQTLRGSRQRPVSRRALQPNQAIRQKHAFGKILTGVNRLRARLRPRIWPGIRLGLRPGLGLWIGDWLLLAKGTEVKRGANGHGIMDVITSEIGLPVESRGLACWYRRRVRRCCRPDDFVELRGIERPDIYRQRRHSLKKRKKSSCESLALPRSLTDYRFELQTPCRSQVDDNCNFTNRSRPSDDHKIRHSRRNWRR